jgi:hypothetical protein
VFGWLWRGFGLVIGYINNLRVVTTINYYIIAALHSVQLLNTILFSLSVLLLTVYNTGTISVSLNHTLQILHINKVFNSHAKSSQANLLYSSVLLGPICSLLACFFACFWRYYSLVTALNWTGIKIKVKVTLRLTVCQSVSFGDELMTRYFYSLTVTTLFFWGAISDDRTGLYFVHAAGIASVVFLGSRVPWDSWPYFTLSDLKSWTGIWIHFSYKYCAQTPRKIPIIIDVFTVTLFRNGSHNTVLLLMLGSDDIESRASSIVAWSGNWLFFKNLSSRELVY